MKYGDIIKRAWTITWRYKALWVLGIFAGVSGCQGGGGSGGGGGNTGFDQPGGAGPDFLSQDFQRFIGIAIVLGIALVAIGLIWFILSLAAEAGLVYAVNEIERRKEPRLGDAWRVGWHNWGRVFGIRFLLGIPTLLLVLVFIGVFLATIIPVAQSGNFEPGPEAFGGVIVSICGAFICGLPLLVLVIVVADLLALTGIRYAVLGDRGVFDSIGSAWKAMRARLKDHALTYIIGGALNAAASFVIAIPIVILGVALLVPTVMAAEGNEPGTAFVGAVAVFVLITVALSMLFNGIWGTFSSAYWTLFFRSVTGMDVADLSQLPVRPAPTAPAGYGGAYGAPGSDPSAPGSAPYSPQGDAPYGTYPGSTPPAPPPPPSSPAGADPFASPPPAPPTGATPVVPEAPTGYPPVGPPPETPPNDETQ